MEVIIKNNNYIYRGRGKDAEPVLRSSVVIIKRSQIKATHSGYVQDEPTREHVNHTFWENDEGDRALLPQDEYEKFLEENHISL